jgi:hypothetical protein
VIVRAQAVLFVALVSLGLVVAQIARLGHMMLVSHSVCEHGALVHGHHAEEHHAADRGRDPVATQGEAPADADHEHCDAAGVKAVAVAVGPACVAPTLLDGELLPWSVRPRPDGRAIAILSLAPKNSPPA